MTKWNWIDPHDKSPRINTSSECNANFVSVVYFGRWRPLRSLASRSLAQDVFVGKSRFYNVDLVERIRSGLVRGLAAGARECGDDSAWTTSAKGGRRLLGNMERRSWSMYRRFSLGVRCGSWGWRAAGRAGHPNRARRNESGTFTPSRSYFLPIGMEDRKSCKRSGCSRTAESNTRERRLLAGVTLCYVGSMEHRILARCNWESANVSHCSVASKLTGTRRRCSSWCVNVDDCSLRGRPFGCANFRAAHLASLDPGADRNGNAVFCGETCFTIVRVRRC
jgi:hypothetical protein